MQPYKICCLTYKALDQLVRRTIENHKDPEIEITIVEGLREEIVRDLEVAEHAGCEVVIGGGANSKIAREFSGLPVIEYSLTAYDYLESVDKAFVLGNKVAICTYRIPIDPTLRSFLDRRGITCSNIIYEGDKDLEEQITAQPGQVIIGAANAVDMAARLGYKNVLIYPGQMAVLDAFHDAKVLAEQLRRQSERSKFAQAVVENSTNGLLLVDSEGMVIDFNAAARQLFGKSTDAVKGSIAVHSLPESGISSFLQADDSEQTAVRKVQGEDVLCTWVRLADKSQETIGAVGIFSGMSEILIAQLEYQKKQQRERTERGFTAKNHFGDVVGSSSQLKNIMKEAQLFAYSDASILIYGETGVGKEIFAQSIHNESVRKNGPFIAINCAALPEQLLESELFGYDEGAFTGGKRGGKKGLFELANMGSIFLDEIGELSPVLQTRLLRVLQEREIMHVGGDRIIPVDVRIISATNRDLEQMDVDKFRRDLYYRLSVLELHLPPLREREKDAMELFAYFFRKKESMNLRLGKLPIEVSRIVEMYDWPGNIRELQNACERFALYIENSPERSAKFLRRCMVRAIGEDRLLLAILKSCDFPAKEVDAGLITLLQEVLGLNKTQVSEKLGISRTTLWRIEK